MTFYNPYLLPGQTKKPRKNFIRVKKEPDLKSYDDVEKSVLDYLNVSKEDILQKTQNREVTKARRYLLWFLWRKTNIKKPDLIKNFGLHRTTVLYHLNTLQEELKVNKETAKEIKKINSII